MHKTDNSRAGDEWQSERLRQFKTHLDFLLERFSQTELAQLMKIDRGNFSKQINRIPSKKFIERFYRAFAHILRQTEAVDPVVSVQDSSEIDRLTSYLDLQFAAILQGLKNIKFGLSELKEDATPRDFPQNLSS